MVSGCTSLSGTGGKGYVTQDGQVTQVPASERSEPVVLSGEGLQGEALDLEELRGEVVVVNIWGAWCVDCRVEQDELTEAAHETEGLAEWVGINIRDLSVEPAQAYVRNYEVPYPSFYSPDGRALLAFSGAVPAKAIPSTLVLDREGRLAAKIIGRLPSKGTLLDLVEDTAGETADG